MRTLTTVVIRSGGYGYVSEDELRDAHMTFNVQDLAHDPAASNLHVYDLHWGREVPLRESTGLNPAVARRVLSHEGVHAFLHRTLTLIESMITYTNPDELVVLLLCRGGRHRSVAMAEHLAFLLDKDLTSSHRPVEWVGVDCRVEHLHILLPVLPSGYHRRTPELAQQAKAQAFIDAATRRHDRQSDQFPGYQEDLLGGRVILSRTLSPAHETVP